MSRAQPSDLPRLGPQQLSTLLAAFGELNLIPLVNLGFCPPEPCYRFSTYYGMDRPGRACST